MSIKIGEREFVLNFYIRSKRTPGRISYFLLAQSFLVHTTPIFPDILRNALRQRKEMSPIFAFEQI